MALTVSALLKERAFLCGLLIRIAAVCLLVPDVQQIWFVDFIRNTVGRLPDPWTIHLAAGGDPLAFPYGVAMYAALAPLTALGAIVDRVASTGALFAGLGFRATLLLADLALLILLRRQLRERQNLLTWLYWLSPAVLFITYWHGQLDIVPVTLFVAAVALIGGGRPALAGLVLGLSVSAKLSMLLVIPFLIIFIERNKRYRAIRARFLTAFALSMLVPVGLQFLSEAARTMILGSPLIWRLLDAAIPVNQRVVVYLFPLAYILLLAMAWMFGRMTLALLHAFLASAFLTIVLLSDAPVGWHLWAVPFIALCGARESLQARAAIVFFWTFLVAAHLTITRGPLFLPLGIDLALPDRLVQSLGGIDPFVYHSLNHTALLAMGIVICYRLLTRALRDTDFYQLSRRPLALGIAGDSGTGKTTLGEALVGVFGARSTALISGDDYHHHDRREPLWKYVTHLDPRVNHLGAMNDDTFSLLAGHEIYSRHYDHASGQFTEPRKLSPRDIVLVIGLHALLPPLLRQRFDLKIFVEMDEGLRQHLKIRRDTVERGRRRKDVEESIQRRLADYERFLLPQRDHADVVFRLLPAADNWHDHDMASDVPKPHRLQVVLHQAIDHDPLVRALLIYCNTRADVKPADKDNPTTLTIDCQDIGPDDTRFLATLLVPEIDEILSVNPVWLGGSAGLMQLIVLLELAQKRQFRGER